ncbi:MAG: DUF1501 domain-containing protein [Anaerolineales bacterium]|nr:DUF1501 domain-containing protein [Anaerolineales bacterium]
MNTYITRRDILRRTGALALGALAFPFSRVALASNSAPTTPSDILVCVFLRGAADGLNLVVPYGDPDYYAARTTLAIAQPKAGNANAAIDLDSFFGLHPGLAPLKPIFNAGALAIVHAVGSPDPTHSHFDAMDFMERGTSGEKAVATGWLARHLQSTASSNKSPFRAVGVGTMVQQSLRGPIPATTLQSIADFRLQVDARVSQKTQTALAALYGGNDFIEENGKLTLQAIRDLAKLTSSNYAPSNNAKYPDTTFGKALATVAQLIKADLGLEVACVDLGGWDMHVQEEAQISRLADEFGKGLGAFHADLQDQMKRITLVTMSEFGRRVQENSNRGTDHGHGGVMFALGGNIKGGKVYGDWPSLSKDKLYGPGDLAITTDWRDVLGEIAQKRLGNSNLAAVFPNYNTFKFRGLAREQAA